MNINWFPGHMMKAVREMEENLSLVDAVIYVIDSRAVKSSVNPIFENLIKDKPVLYLFQGLYFLAFFQTVPFFSYL